jgi:predicted Ser/Thr protein kinase
LININNVYIPKQDYKTAAITRNINLHLYRGDSVYFTSNADGFVVPDDIDKQTIIKLKHDSIGVKKIINSGYLARVFRYESVTGKTYAIKKTWPEGQQKHATANPVKQLNDEIKAYKKLGDIKGIPQLYGHSNESDNSNILENHFLILEWVEGKPVSTDGTFYEFDKINKEKLKKIFDLMFEFDKKGVLHNDLWAANILFTDNDVNIIDFNRSEFFDPHKEYSKSNLQSFKERFLHRYLSDINDRLGEDKFLEVYKDILDLEINLLNKRAEFELSNGNLINGCKLINSARKLGSLQGDEIKNKAVKEIFESDITCGKIYTKYFEFEENEAIKSFQKAGILKKKYPDLFSYNEKLINSNLDVISNTKLGINQAKDQDIDNCFKTFQKIQSKLKDTSIYSEKEQQEDYYKKLSEFTELNIDFIRSLKNNSRTASLEILQKNEQFFKLNKKIGYYKETLETLAENNKFTLDILNKNIPDIDSFCNGQAVLFDSKGKPVLAQISEVNPSDADQVDKWYSSDSSGRPYYADQKWHDWWIDKISNGEPDSKIFKMEINNEILGIMMIRPSLKNYSDKRLITLVRGLRISPSCNKQVNRDADYKGVGTALITYAAIESAKRNNVGIGINSSKGAEGFYEKICGPSRELAFDGIRSFFSLTDNARSEFIIKQFNKYQKLKDEISDKN